MKKIISFSLWGEDPLYLNGAVWNAENRYKFYPDWNCRFYIDDTVPDIIVKKLYDAGCEIRVMGRTTDVLGMYWRFHPMFDDENIDRFIVRDTDSKFTDREVAMVSQWIASTKPFHIIRDCESHQTSILGGTWGSIPGYIPNFEIKMSSFIFQLKPDSRNPRGLFHGTDQMFLHRHVWPLIKDNHVAHIRKGIPALRLTEDDIEVPDPEDGHYVGMVA